MKQEVILDFLNLPGIAGVALMDKRSRPYFCGIDHTLNFQQKEALTQGILQVFETIPDEFESFEFYFSGYQVYIYKLDRGVILLILAQDNLVYADYLKTIKNLKALLKEDIVTAISTFRLTAGSATLPGINLSRRQSTQRTDMTTSTATKPPAAQSVPPAGATAAKSNAAATPTPPINAQSGVPDNGLPNRPGASPPGGLNGAAKVAAGSPAVGQGVTVGAAIAALNQLSQFTTQYLGNHVVVNYWKATRPAGEWLAPIQVERSAQLSLPNATPQQLQTPLSSEQQADVQAWVASFVKRCSQVVRDFPGLVQQKALNDEQKKLLLG